MISFETFSFAMIMIIAVAALFRMVNEARKNAYMLVLNMILGGGLYVLLNLMKIPIFLNAFTGTIITLLGIHGVCLIVLLKVIFKIF